MKLSAELACRYDTLKKVVRDNIGATRKLWGALKSIKAEKLYLQEYDTWEEFCKDQYDFSARHADRLIEAGETVETLPIPNKLDDSIRPIGLISNEAQARELGKVPEEKRAAVIEKAAANGNVTAASIAHAAKNLTEKPKPYQKPALRSEPKPDIRLDSIGREIPRDMIEEWDRAATVANRLRSCASEIKVTVERGLADKDLIFGEITNPTIAEAASLHYTLSQIAPYAVCPVCQGRSRKACQLCRKRGWISKYLYQSPAVSSETKAILERARK